MANMTHAQCTGRRLHVTVPHRNKSHSASTLRHFGTTIARQLAYENWVEQAFERAAAELPARGSTHAALAFDGMVLRPAGGPDVLGMLAMFPRASSFWVLGDGPFGRFDHMFWGQADVRLRRARVARDLGDFVGPHGWLPSATELRYLGADSMNDVGVYPTVFALLTLAGYRIESVGIDTDKSVLVLDHGGGEVKLQTVRLEFCKLGATRAAPDGPCKVLWYTEIARASASELQRVVDVVSSHLLRSAVPLAGYLIGAEFTLLATG
jgi:hypothetical protein